YLPQIYVGATSGGVHVADLKSSFSIPPAQRFAVSMAEATVERIEDDRQNLEPNDSILLIVEDDPHYARVLCDLARDLGFKVLVALKGSEALALTREYHPTAVSLDVFLPDMLGWTVLNHLKQDPATRH